jgi:ABC-type amino acid transport substrate-binding protein
MKTSRHQQAPDRPAVINSGTDGQPPTMKTRDFLCLLACAALPIPSCAPGSSAAQDPNAPPPLRVGVSGNNAPLIFESGRGQFAGVEAAFARMLGEELGREIRFVPMRFDRLIPALQRGEIDIIMSGMTVTAQRRSLVDFTTPYMASGQGLLVRNAKANLFQDPQLLFISPFRIGVEQGAIGEVLASRLHPQSTVLSFSTPERAARALLSDRVDVVLHDAPVLWNLTARNPAADYRLVPRLLANETLAWAVRRGDSQLLRQANAAIAKWRGNGRLHSTLRSYMPNYQILKQM